MSLLEDVFLEDEAGEAQELERVIEGDEFEERPRTPNSNDDSEKEDEAVEDKRRVDYTAKAKKVVKNPRFVLNPARLTGPRGIQILPDHFKDFKFKGKGHEREDLELVLKKLEHWAYRLYPKFKFDDCLKKIETLGKKRPVMVHLHKIRTDQFMSEETVVQQDSSGDEAEPAVPEEDEFDRLLQQQIEIARNTPAPGSVRKELHTPVANRSPLLAPKATSSPSISDEQKERMMRNKKLAEERRLAKLNQLNATVNNNTENDVINESESAVTVEKTDIVVESNNIDKDDVQVGRKHNRSNIIDSSDEESDVTAVNGSITVDVHDKVLNEEKSNKNNIETKEISVINESESTVTVEKTDIVIESNNIDKDDDVQVGRKHNRSNIIDSSDEESDVTAVNGSITVDVHGKVPSEENTNNEENNITETEEMTVESDHVNKIDDGIINQSERVGNDKDTAIESTNDPAVPEINHSEVNEEILKETVVLENEPVKDKGESANDADTTNSEFKDKDSLNDKVSTEDLMEVDFSDDF